MQWETSRPDLRRKRMRPPKSFTESGGTTVAAAHLGSDPEARALRSLARLLITDREGERLLQECQRPDQGRETNQKLEGWLLVFLSVRSAFAGLFQARVPTQK